jgi:hypothetical protein
MRTNISRDFDGSVLAVFVFIHEGEIIDREVDPDKIVEGSTDGVGWVHRDDSGKLLRVDLMQPVTLDKLRRIAGADTAAAEYLMANVPAGVHCTDAAR